MSPMINMRRFSRSSSLQNQHPTTATRGAQPTTTTTTTPGSPPVSYTPPEHPQTQTQFRPSSSSTNTSFEVTHRPTSQQITPSSTLATQNHLHRALSGGNMSRTDLIVLKHFWESKHQENLSRDLHFLNFPFFSQYPSDKELRPFCEIYHLVKMQPGAKIMGLGTANGVYIGFELFSGSQLHIDMDSENGDIYNSISHFRVSFKPFDKMLQDTSVPGSVHHGAIKDWPKPLTIEFLEEQYLKWQGDLMSICWEGKEVRTLGEGGI